MVNVDHIRLAKLWGIKKIKKPTPFRKTKKKKKKKKKRSPRLTLPPPWGPTVRRLVGLFASVSVVAHEGLDSNVIRLGLAGPQLRHPAPGRWVGLLLFLFLFKEEFCGENGGLGINVFGPKKKVVWNPKRPADQDRTHQATPVELR